LGSSQSVRDYFGIVIEASQDTQIVGARAHLDDKLAAILEDAHRNARRIAEPSSTIGLPARS
jgi:hypothetical protein